MSVDFCGLELAHPVINGSGTFDAIAARRAFGEGLCEAFPFAAYVSKTITLRSARDGNPPPRLWEAPAGLINSIGLPNKGLERYLAEDLPELASLTTAVAAGGGDAPPPPLITNVMGSTAAEFAALVEACEARDEIAAVELNVSCPNVRTGLDIGADPRQLEDVVRAVREQDRKPLIVKLTPNTRRCPGLRAGRRGRRRDAVSLINTLRAMALSPAGRRPTARTVARRPHRRAVRARRARRRSGPGRGRRRAGRDPRRRHGRRADRRARAGPDRCRGHARRDRHRELSRPGRRGPDRARTEGDDSGLRPDARLQDRVAA